MEQELFERTRKILSELKVSDCEIKFIDFAEKARDPSLFAQGYNPEFLARADNIKNVIEINTVKIHNPNFMHWRNWGNILAHEVGHLIINAPEVDARYGKDLIGYRLLEYQHALYSIAQDMTIPHHILPSKYTSFDLSQINPWDRYSKGKNQVKDIETRWAFRLALAVRLPCWYAYGHYDKGSEGRRILLEIDRIVQQEPLLRYIASATEDLIKPYAEGLDCRNTDLQRLVEKGFQSFKLWVDTKGKL